MTRRWWIFAKGAKYFDDMVYTNYGLGPTVPRFTRNPRRAARFRTRAGLSTWLMRNWRTHPRTDSLLELTPCHVTETTSIKRGA